MKKINFNSSHRRKHFDFFRQMDQPHFNVTANVEIQDLLAIIKSEQLPFTVTMVYLLSKVANEIPEFRWRIRNEEVVEHTYVHPSFSVRTDLSDVFSFCMVPFQESFVDFAASAKEAMEKMRKHPSFEDEEGRDDYLFMSSFPWVTFTGVMHPMHYHPVDSVPRIVWGKYFVEGNKVKMPLSVQAHHAVVDGIHMGQYFQKTQEYIDQAEHWVKNN